eukprot:SM000020S06094  [mRNA]  locus=s20:1140836:1142960:+ [translate_table: standard]
MLYTACLSSSSSDIISSESIVTCYNLGKDYDTSCNNAMCSSTTSRCELDRRADGFRCNAASGGYTNQCANLTCQAGICTLHNALPRANHTCTDPPERNSQWDPLCFDARCSSDGRCLFKTFQNSSKDCSESNKGLRCSSYFCNGNGVCSVPNNYTDGTPCYSHSADYQCANTSCTKGVCVGAYNGKSSCNLAAPNPCYIYTCNSTSVPLSYPFALQCANGLRCSRS